MDEKVELRYFKRRLKDIEYWQHKISKIDEEIIKIETRIYNPKTPNRGEQVINNDLKQEFKGIPATEYIKVEVSGNAYATPLQDDYHVLDKLYGKKCGYESMIEECLVVINSCSDMAREFLTRQYLKGENQESVAEDMFARYPLTRQGIAKSVDIELIGVLSVAPQPK